MDACVQAKMDDAMEFLEGKDLSLVFARVMSV